MSVIRLGSGAPVGGHRRLQPGRRPRGRRLGQRHDGRSSTATVVHPGDAGAQTRQALATIKQALERAGFTMNDVVRTRIFVTDISRWEEVGRAHGEVFGDIRPATTMVQVAALIDPRDARGDRGATPVRGVPA